MMNRDKIIILLLSLIVIVLLFYFMIFPSITKYYYVKGVNDAVFAVAQRVTTQGQVPVLGENNTVQWVQLNGGGQ